jgi:hypothetical protein
MTEPLRRDAARNRVILERTPMARWGTPEDLVGPALFGFEPESLEAVVPFYLLIGAYQHWYSVWYPPGRYLAAVLPLGAYPMACALKRAGAWRPSHDVHGANSGSPFRQAIEHSPTGMAIDPVRI